MGLHAQPWMPQYTTGPVKFQDILDNYRAHPVTLPVDNDDLPKGGKIVKENKDYQFERWAWYWSMHLDSKGYLVNPSKTWEEWQKYQSSKASDGAASRSTSGVPSNWTFQGPDSTPGGYSGIGRMSVMAFHPTDPKIIYAGSAGGGLWKTIDSGYHWLSLYSDYPTLGVADIAINPLNPNTIYVATGDPDGWSNFSMGVIKSTDGGATWNTTSINWTPLYYNWIRSLALNPLDTNKLVIATRGYIATTYDGCASYYSDTSGDFNQVLYHPTDTTIIYAARYPVYPDSSAQIMRSHDGGAHWTQVTHFTDAQRINLAVCPASTNVVKAIVSNQKSGLEGIYGSTDTGASFTSLYYNDTFCTHNLLSWDMGMPSTACDGQGWYDLSIAMNPGDPNKVVIGGINTYYSNDGGYNWALATSWYEVRSSVATVHADKHCLKYNPLDTLLYEACDGGLYRARTPGDSTWQNITNGMGITQFYRIAVDNGVSFCIGGAQDDGTKMVNAGIYTDLTGGDGMQCRIDYSNPYNNWYTATQNGNINATTDGGATYHNISGSIPDTLSGIWLTPYIINPDISTTLLVGIDKVFSSNDMGGFWAPISPQFTPYSFISQLAMTPEDDRYIYALVQNGSHNYYNTLHYTTDYGTTWDTITTYAFTNSLAGIIVDPKDKNTLWVTFSGYGSEKVAKYSLTTGSWIMYSAASLPDVPVNCIVIDTSSSTRYIGTDVGVYYMDTTMTSWALFSHNLPTVQVEDLQINYTTGELWAGTYGRGIWKTTKRDIPNGVAAVKNVAGSIKVLPNPNNGTFTINTATQQLYGQNVNVRILSAEGKTVWRTIANFDVTGNLKVNAKGLHTGVYTCEISTDRILQSCKVEVDQ